VSSNVIFFIRAFNDVDHLTPIIARMSREKNCFVLCMSLRFDFSGNQNIQFLEEKCGVKTQSFYDIPYLPRSLWKWFHDCFHFFYERIKWNIFKGVFNRFRWESQRRYFGFCKDRADQWVPRFFDAFKPCSLIFDHTAPNSFLNEPLLKEAQSRSIPTFSLPHGMTVFTNYDIGERKLAERGYDVQFDHVASQGPLSRSHLEYAGTPANVIVDLGSLRFSQNWMDFYAQNIIDRSKAPLRYSDKIHVCFFLSKLKYNAHVHLIYETVELLAKRSDIKLILKPHTRDMEVGFLDDLIKKYNIDIEAETSSVLLSEWSDFCLVSGSSIALQVLHDKKILMYMDYLDDNQSIYKDRKASWVIESLSELENAIRTIKDDKNYRPYSQECVDEMFEYLVYANKEKHDVVESYFNFIERKISL
jgi:hypothetical protein